MTGENLKLIFAGLDKAGKTTIYKATMEEMSTQEIQNLRPTRGIERHAHDFLDTDFQVWDLGGQKSYRDTYLSRPEVFNQTKAMIFVVDIQDIDRLEEAFQYYCDILKVLVNVETKPNLYVLFHKFDPDKRGKLRSHFYKATRLFRQADSLIDVKFKGYATSIYSNGIDLAVKRILFENFEQFKEPDATIKATPKATLQEQETVSSIPTPVTQESEPSIPIPKGKEEEIETEPIVAKETTEVKEVAEAKEEEVSESKIEEEIDNATPKFMDDLSTEVVDRLTDIINKRMKDTPEIVALSILNSEGKQALAVAKTELDYDRLATLREVVGSLNPKQFFKDLTDIEYRGLGHFSLSDFDIYFARASDEYAVAVLATDVSTLMLQNAQRIVRSIRQGLGTVADDEDGEEEEKPKTKKDLVTDLRSRLKSITGLDNLNT